MINTIVKYFLRGLIFITPVGVVVLLIIYLIDWIEEYLVQVHLSHLELGIILLCCMSFITFLGYVGSNFLIRPFGKVLDNFFKSIPVVNVVYTSIKDLMNAFVGDKKKFNVPVIVKMEADMEKLGFVTNENLQALDTEDKVAVYFPKAYGFMGDLYIVDKNKIRFINASGADVMKFIVSGGVTTIDERKDKKEEVD